MVSQEYPQIGLGRPAPEGAVADFADSFLRSFKGLKVLEHSGLIHIPGYTAAKVQPFTRRNGAGRLPPHQAIMESIWQLRDAGKLQPSAGEPVSVEVRRMKTDRLGGGKLKVLAVLGDVPTAAYPESTGQLLSEKIVTVRELTVDQTLPKADRSFMDIQHFVPIATADMDMEDALRDVFCNDPVVSPGTVFQLEPVGPVPMPLERY